MEKLFCCLLVAIPLYVVCSCIFCNKFNIKELSSDNEYEKSNEGSKIRMYEIF